MPTLVGVVAVTGALYLAPVAVLLGVLFWWFLWGVSAAFVAVPVLAVAKILTDRSKRWSRFGEVLGE